MMMTESLYQLRGFFRCVRIPEYTFVEPQLITTVQMDKSKNKMQGKILEVANFR